MLLKAPPTADIPRAIQKCGIPRWKRRLDLCGVMLLAPFMVPLFVLVAIYIKLVSRGPAFFVQSRVGHGGENFRIYKFRTMHVPKVSRDAKHRDYVASHSRANGPIKKPSYESELIRGGLLLRKAAIDELPQLLNVLLGNMSLVGPRPDVMHLEDYTPDQQRRFEVLPGMTGLWQVSGKNRLTFDQMIDLDVEYVETHSLALDLKIMAKTVSVLLLERNE